MLTVESGVVFSATEAAIKALLESAGWGDTLFPGAVITSAQREPGAEGYASDNHNTFPFTAIDFGGSNQAIKDQMAAWLYQFGQYFQELIHEFNSVTNQGLYIKNGVSMGWQYYGDTTDDAHLDHVHLAMTLAMVAQMQGDHAFQVYVVAYQNELRRRNSYVVGFAAHEGQNA